MRKLYSIVLMATALLIGTNVKAQGPTTWADLRTALQAGGEVTLGGNIEEQYDASTFKSIWIGASTLSGDAPAAVLNLDGKNITIDATSAASYVAVRPFVLSKGSLEIKGTGTITVKGKLTESTNVFFVFGADEANKVDPKGENPFTHLKIGKDVTVKTENGTVIAIDRMTGSGHAALTDVVAPEGKTKPNYTTNNMAHGVFVDVFGNLSSDGATYTTKKCYGIKVNGNVGVPADADKKYAPYVHVEPGAVITSDMRTGLAGSTAIYASGYGQWLIEGNCSGASGVYISSGIVAVNNATVKSGAAYDAATAGTHANGSGNAITINSRETRPGDVEVTISGTSNVTSTNGYAIEEKVTSGAGTQMDALTITGGEFQGSNDQIIDQVVSQEGSTAVVVIGTKDASDDVVVGDVTFVNDMANDIVKLDATSANIAKTLPAGVTEVKYLSLTGKDSYTSTVTVEAGKTLKVGQIVMNANGRLVVKAGGKLIVTGSNGIFADNAENLVLETSIANPSIFLLNPAVTSNRNPKAKVEFLAKSFQTGAGKYIYQRFGLPMMKNGLDLISGEGDPRTRFWSFDYSSNAWVALGYINPNEGQAALDYTKLNDPFEYYQMYNFAGTSEATKYTLEGRLLGNSEPMMNVLENSWKGFANSYMGQISLPELLTLIPDGVDKAIYTYDINAVSGNWNPVTNLNSASAMLNPMQPFLIRNRYDAAEVELDYEKAVYNPTLGIKNNAPRKAAVNNITMAKIAIANEYSQDYIIVAEDAQFSAEFDNGYDASKFMNEGINMYVSADEKMSIFATDNLENTYVGFQSVEGGKYTISFADVKGSELTLIDHETGARVAMVEGATYEFTAGENTVNDYRFEIVGRANMPTAIDNTEAVKSAKGVYTITGQYVGEMNVWNTLPAGVYVVNGEKRVK